jgi:hypothetical protein
MVYGRWTSYTYMKQNKETPAITLSGVGRGRGRETMGMVTNVQYKSNWNCHYESPPRIINTS